MAFRSKQRRSNVQGQAIDNRRARRFRGLFEKLEDREMLTGTAFTPGDLVVVRLGGTAGDPVIQGNLTNPVLSTAGPAPIFLDEYTPAGVWVESVPMPTTGANPLTAAGTDFTADNLSRTENGQELLITGYDKPTTSLGNPSNDSSLATPREVGQVDSTGTLVAQTNLTDFESGGTTTGTIRSAASVDGSSLYVLGVNDVNAGETATGGLHYVASSTDSTSVNLSQSTSDNMRQLQIIDGQLFMTAGATIPGRTVFKVGSGLPTTQASSTYNPLFTALPNTSSENYNAFLLLDLSPTNGDPTLNGADTLYITNSGAGGTGPSIDKYNYSNATGKWAEVSSTPYGGTQSTTVGSLYGLTGYNTGSGVALYLTTTQGGSGASQLLSMTDTSGYGNANNGTFNVLDFINNPIGVNPGANTVFKGIQFVPSLAPTVTTDAGSASYTEGASGTVVDSTLTLGDPDAVTNDISSATIQISGGYVQGEDTLSFTAPGGSGITGFFSTADGVLHLQGVSTLANYQAALQSVQYSDGSQNPSTTTRTISFTTTDVSQVSSTAATRSVTVTAVNNAPTVTVPAAQTISTNSGLTFSTGNGNAISVADVDGNSALEQMTLSVNAGTFSLGSTAGLSFSFSDANGTGTGTGTNDTTATFRGTLAAINSALQGMVFAAPGSAQTVTLNTSLNDLGNTGTGGALTGTGSVSITVNTHVDVAPVVTTTGSPLSYTENAGAVAIDPGITVTDSDSANLTGATVSITSGYDGTQDTLSFTPQGNIHVLSNVGGVLTLTGLASPAAYQTALESVTYTNSSDNPSASRTITFSASDGIAAPATATRNISIVAVNDPPTNTVPGVQSVSTSNIHVFNSTNGNLISIADVDAGSSTVQVTLSVNGGTVSLSTIAGLSFSFSDSNGTGTGTGTHDATATFRGTIAAINAALNGLTYTSPAAAQSVTLSLSTDDLGNTGTGGPLTTTNTVPINVVAPVPLVIQQILWNPPGADVPNQYIEIRAVPGLNGSSYAGGVYTIPADTYLEALEGDGGPGPNPGSVNDIFNIGGFTTGSDGVLILLQQENYYKDAGFFDVTDPNAHVVAETAAPGYGNDGDPIAPPNDSQVGHTAASFATGGNIEDPSASWFLYQSSVAPTINDDVDALNNGVPGGSIWSNWVVADSIGILDSSSDIVDYSYAQTTFVDTHGTGQAMPGTTVVPINFTAGFVSRTNNTNGSGATDWLAANVTGVNPPISGQPAQFALDPLQTSLSGYNSLPLDSWNVSTNTTTQTLGNFGNTYVTPVIDINGNATDGRNFQATFNQGSGAVNVGNSSGLVVLNYGNASENLTSATVAISNLLDGASESLSATTTGTPISASYNSGSGVLTLSGSATLAQYQQVLRTVMYNDTATTPNLASRTLTFSATDGTYTSAPSTTTVGMFSNTLPVVRINEIDVNPPGNDNPYEYVEIEGPAGLSLTNYYFASVEGDDVDPATAVDASLIGNTGRATYVANLSGQTIGSNGILIIEASDGFTPAAGAAVDIDPLFDNTGGKLQNGSNSFLLVYSPHTTITAYQYDPTSGTVTATGTDFDNSGNGVTRDNGTLTMPSGAQLVDNVGWVDGGSSFDIAYGSAVLPLESGAPAAATRIPGNTSQSPSAWYYGTLNPTSSSEVAYNSGNIGPLPASSPNLPAGAVLTPGAPNFAPTASTPPSLTAGGGTAGFTAGGPAVAVDNGLTVTPGSTDTSLTGATVTINSPLSGDTLNFTTQNGISVVSNTGGVLTLGGTSSVANYQTALRSVTFSNSTNTTVSNRTFSIQADDSAASPTTSNSLPETVNVFAPVTVSALYVKGSAWTSTFNTYLGSHTLGNVATPTLGFALQTGANQTKPLPWSNINTVEATFSGAVNISQSSLVFSGGTGGSTPSVTGFSSLGNNTYSWTLSSSLSKNHLEISFLASGANAVTDTRGAGLDGEWSTSTSTFSSADGNGLSGGNFNFMFSSLVGDQDRSGLVNATDYGAVRQKLNDLTTNVNYVAFDDIDGSGLINATDYGLVRSRLNNTVPANAPAPQTAQVGGLQTDDSLTGLALGVQEGSTSSTGTPFIGTAAASSSVANVISTPVGTYVASTSTSDSSDEAGTGGSSSAASGSSSIQLASTDAAVAEFDLTDLWV